MAEPGKPTNDGPDAVRGAAPTADLQARSEWAELNDFRTVTLRPSRDLPQGVPLVVIPGSKSLTNRALILAALAEGRSRVAGLLQSDDSFWCLGVLRALGVSVSLDGHEAEIAGIGAAWPHPRAELYVGGAGTLARFLPPALCVGGAADARWTIDAGHRMRERPMRPLLDALRNQGARIEYLGQEGHYPFALYGGGLAGGEVALSGSISSQFVSGLLIAAPYAASPLTVRVPDGIVQHAYVRMTLRLMEEFGVATEATPSLDVMRVPRGRYTGREIRLEPDVSTACYFMALAAITGRTLRLDGISRQTDQPDIGMIDVLTRMGCRFETGPGYIEVTGPARLTGGFTVSMREMSDQALTLAAIAALADAPIAITDVAHIRGHESDRLHAIAESLTRLGIRVEEAPDGVRVHPGAVQPALVDSYDDHRVAMSLSLLGAVVPGIRVNNPGCVSKTFPQFYREIAKLGIDAEFTA